MDEMDDKHKTHDLSHGECARCDNVLTNEKKQDKAHTHSGVRVVSDNGHVVIGVRIVQCYHAIMANSEHVVIGVRIVQCYHAIMSNSDFSTFWSQFHLGPNFNLLSGCMN